MVLVIDDDRSFRDLVTLGLVTNGFAVSGASDGLEGLTRLATCRPVAILTDMQMPRMDGLAFCLRVRSMPAFDNTPIVVLSGGDLSSERIVAVTRLPGVTASGKVMPMKTLAALLRGGCGAPVARLQTGCVADGTRAESLGSSARPALAGTVGPVLSP